MSPLVRRVVMVSSMALVAAASYGAGVVTGVVGSSSSSNGVIDAAADRIEESAAQPVDRAELERAAVEGMLKALGDRWSSYYDPSQYGSFEDALEGRYSGVGLWVQAGSNGIEVSSVQNESPAATAGIVPGDLILAVDGSSTTTDSVGDVVQKLRGPTGSEVTLTLLRDGIPSDVTVTRTELETSDVTVEHLADGVLRIDIRTFTRGVGRDVRDAMTTDPDGHSGGVILDLRGNPGGFLDEAVEVASAFLDGGAVVSYEQRDEPDRTLNAIGEGDTQTPVVVLVDGGTASAAEVVAAALQDRSRAVIVGARTYGKGSVQEPSVLPDGSAIEFTIGRYITPAGRVIDGRGVEPDVLVDPLAAPEVAEQRALEVLRGLTAALPLPDGG
ncbi:MAG TPA: S41 family peptidase [Actinomycetes bacterium]|nr:S41 family peptidase [Actinomycetes bacterium]